MTIEIYKSPDYLDEYGWNSNEGPNSCNYIQDKILSIIERFNISKLVDVGSGNGALCKYLADRKIFVCGIERDTQGFLMSKKLYPEIPFYNIGVEAEPDEIIARHGLFQAVVSTEVIEHLYSPHLLPIFAKNLLNDSGWLIISTPYHGYIKNLVISLFNLWDSHHTSLWHGGHIKFWSKKTLKKLLENNGFDLIEFHGVGRFPLLWKSMILLARKR